MNFINKHIITILEWIGVNPQHLDTTHRAILLALTIGLAFLVDYLCRRIVIPIIKALTAKTKAKWDDHLLNDHVLNNTCHLVVPIILYVMLPLVLPHDSNLLHFTLRLCLVSITAVTVRIVCAFFNSLYHISNETGHLRNHPLKGVFQMFKLLTIGVGVIVIISILIDKEPDNILAGLGASAAILMLVFKDTIMGLVAGVQLSANDMLRPGDWITMPKYGVDGDVLEVTLTTVKVQNWDKTIVTVPPYALVSDSLQNWRGMRECGGRRTKRSINIDMQSVRFCTAKEMAYYKQQPWFEGFENSGSDAINLSVFRHYVEYYLSHNPRVNQKLIQIVRQLQPTPEGIPVELYFFSADTNWIPYEHLQADVFDHVLAVIPQFNLRVFQRPSGLDLVDLKN